jgi:hypothetical protein
MEIPSLLCTGGILKPPTRPEPGITAVKLTLRCTSVAGSTQCARRQGQVSYSDSPTIHHSQPTGPGGAGPSPLPGAELFQLCAPTSIPRQLKASQFRELESDPLDFAGFRSPLVVSHTLKFLTDHTPAREPDERACVHSAADRRSAI